MLSYLYIIEHTEVADELSLPKNTDLTRVFITKTPRLTKKQIWVEKNISGSPGHMRQNAYYRNLK